MRPKDPFSQFRDFINLMENRVNHLAAVYGIEKLAGPQGFAVMYLCEDKGKEIFIKDKHHFFFVFALYSCHSVLDVKDALRFDEIGYFHGLLVLSLALHSILTCFGQEIEFEKFVCPLAILVDVKVDTEVSIG